MELIEKVYLILGVPFAGLLLLFGGILKEPEFFILGALCTAFYMAVNIYRW